MNNQPLRSISNTNPQSTIEMSGQKPQSDSTSASLGDEAQKIFFLNNTKNKLSLNNNNINNKNNMELQNINDDIFPKERQGGNYNYINEDINMYNELQINSGSTSIKKPENMFEKNKEIILLNDIPEMLLYKYNYDIEEYKESLNDIDYEVNWIYHFLNINKVPSATKEENDIKACLKDLLTHHKIKKLDIPYIIANYEDMYNRFFRQNEVFDILSIFDVEFLRLQKKRKKVKSIYEYILQNDDLGLGQKLSKYLIKENIFEAKTNIELDLIEALLSILIYVNQSNTLDENFQKLINVNILENLKIDYSLLNKIKDDKLESIISKFCLSPEEVVHNIKVIKGELKGNIIEPPFPGCPLNEICKKTMMEKTGKYMTPKEILMTSFQHYNLILALNPYIFNLIYDSFYKNYTLNTEPTEKGKEILNPLHPSYYCKNIKEMPIEKFFEEKNLNLCNIYTKNTGEIFLNIEKCVNNGLIKYEFKSKIDESVSDNELKKIKNLLSKAINGINDNNNDKMEVEEKNINVIQKKKYKGARDLCIDNLMIISKDFFINIITKKMHNYSEKNVIKKISNEFFNMISRNFLGNIIIDQYSYIFSIIYNPQKNYFKLLCLNSDFNYKHRMELNYIWKSENLIEKGFLATLELSKEQDILRRLFDQYKPKAIVIDVSNLESYKMINYLRNKFRDYNLIYSDYNSKMYKIKPNNMTQEQEIKTAIEQVRYVINPVNQLIDLWSYKYEDNLLLNLPLHPLQDSIKDIPFLCYSLENQVIRVINSTGIYLDDLAKYSFHLYNFICGFGPSTCSLIIDSFRNFKEFQTSLRKNSRNLYNNMERYFIENKIYQNDCIYKLKESKEEIGLVKSEVFYSMIKDKIYIKKYCLCNAIVNNIDTENFLINCFLIRDENNIKAVLKFNNIDTSIKNIKEYFYPQRIILCKIIDIKPRHNSYEIEISNKLEDLLSIKDFFKDQKNMNNILLEEKYSSIDNNDFIIQGIKELKEIKESEEKKNDDQKKLHYTLINMENEQFFRNVDYNILKKINVFDYKIRPSFRGENYLRLSFLLIDDIYLNYDIEIFKTEIEETLIDDNDKETKLKKVITKYKLKNMIYSSLTELVNKFATKMSNSIYNFKKNDYFKKPEEIHALYTKIFGIEYKNKNKSKVKEAEDKKDIIKTNVIILGFLKEEPEYGIIFTKANNELNYTIDFIKIMYNGYLYQGVLYNNLKDFIFNYKENRKISQYQNVFKSQLICTTHSQIEEIDETYTEFDGIDPNLERFNQSYNFSYNDVNKLKDNLLTNDVTINNDNNLLLGKKRTSENVWGSDAMNGKNDNGWNNNENENNDAWGNSYENNKINIKSDNDNKISGFDSWNETNNENNNNNDPWNTTKNNENNNNNFDGWNTGNDSNDNWADANQTSDNSKNFNKKNYSNNNGNKFDKPRKFNNKNNNFNNNNKFNKNNNNRNNKNKSNFGWKNKDSIKQVSNFDWNTDNDNDNKNQKSEFNWESENNNENADSWGKDNNNTNKNNSKEDFWSSNDNNNDSWGSSNNNKKEDKNGWSNSNDNNGWSNDNANDNNGWSNNNMNKNNHKSNWNDTWKESKSNDRDNNSWGKNNTKNNNNSWADSSNNNNSWGNNNTKNNNDSWGNKNSNQKDSWADSSNNNNSWGNNNNNNKNDPWGDKNDNNSWGNNNKNKTDSWADSSNNNSWGNNNKNNNNSWGDKKENDSWGNNNNNKNDSWGDNNDNDPWGSSKNNNDSWGNNKNNNNDSWGSNNNNKNDSWGNNNNNDSWADSPKNHNFKNNLNNNKGNRFNNNNFNNKGNKNNNSKNNSFDKNKRNWNNNKNNDNNNKRNNSTYTSNWGNNYKNNNNKFNFKGKNSKNSKNEKRWANELNKTNEDMDVKQEKDEGVVDFENYEGFGGFGMKQENHDE